MKLSPIALKILKERYLRKDEKGNVIETPDELFRRVASAISRVERAYGKTEKETAEIGEQFYRLMTSLDFLPNSPCLMNAGTELGQLAACFVLPIEDSMESIFETLKNAAIIHKTGGGTGFSFSRLRPKGDIVKSTRGVSSGPVSFLKVYDAATEQIKQGGKRRGANMGVLVCNHPDIEEFVNLKRNPGTVKNFNISVALTDEFMECLKKNGKIPLINPRNREKTGEIPASHLFELIAENAWRTGDPGALFIDTINRYNPTPHLGSIEATNPCGEQPLLPYESCVLGSINLSNFVLQEDVDWERLKETVYLAVRFLDNVIDANTYPIPQIEKMTKRTRKIGLGIMGLADAFIKMDIPYGDEASFEKAAQIMEFIQFHSKLASVELARERGSFPEIEKSIYSNEKKLHRFLNTAYALNFDWKPLIKEILECGIRNATTTTVAPTGSISLIANCSSGIEPLFALAYRRKILEKEEVTYIHPLFQKQLERLDIPHELKEKIIKTGRISDIKEIPEKIKRLFVTTYDISLEKQIRMQKAIQTFTDNAVSKTINLPNHATVEEVKRAYQLAYEMGLKGITVFRDRCLQEQVISPGIREERALYPRERPKITKGATIKMKTGCGNLYVTVNEDEKGLVEVFSQLGKTGGCAASQLEAISRLISLALRSGIGIEAVIKQIEGIRCPNPSWDEGEMLLSCADAIAKAIKRYIKSRGIDTQQEEEGVAGICPDCGSILRPKEGCILCECCGYSRC
ncbi:MAG: vitamin B12-dependent ribonucleotide reductase [Deferribacteres bacterium]|nr:vitamin B12-dependent ribonucleotide reductase [Deferribacteres bacterium]